MRKRTALASIALATSLTILSSCASDDGSVRHPASVPSATASHSAIRTLEGESFLPEEALAAAVLGGEHLLYLFVGARCPISNALSPEMGRIYGDYAGESLAVYLVFTDPDEDASVIRKHVEEYQLAGTVLLDFEHVLAKSLGISVTPEAALVSPSGALVYRGRIDDRYVDFGKQRAAPGQRDLRLALDAVLAGKLPEVQRTIAIGCYLPELTGVPARELDG